MRYLIFGFLFMICGQLFSQAYSLPDCNRIDEVRKYKYVIQYKECVDDMRNIGGVVSISQKEVMRIKGFYTFDKLMEWLNSARFIMIANQRVVRMEPDQLVGVYDLGNGEEIHIRLMEEKKHKERRIVV